MSMVKLMVLTVAVSSLMAPKATAQTFTAGKLSIAGVSTSGEGCKSDEVGTYISEDGQVFTLSLDNYQAALAAGSTRQPRKTCEVTLDLQVAPGWSFSVVRTDAVGYASIDKGISGVLRMFSRMNNRPYQNIASLRVTGEYYGDYEAHGQLGLNARQWSSCSAAGKASMSIFTDLTLQRLSSNNIAYEEMSNHVQQTLQHIAALIAAIKDTSGSRAPSVASGMALSLSLSRMLKLSHAQSSAARIRLQYQVAQAQHATLERSIDADRTLKVASNVLDLRRDVVQRIETLRALANGQVLTSAALMTVDTIDGEITQKYGIAWRRCVH